VSVADLDGDGKPDILTANQNANSVTILHGASNTATQVNVGTQANWVVAADLDNDGHQDLAVTSSNGFVTLLVSPR